MTRPIIVVGDWNAGPKNPDRHRPRWIAHRAQLLIHPSGDPICYPISDAALTDVRRGLRMGSDHPPILLTAVRRPGGDLVRIASYNLLAGRDPDQVVDEIRLLLHRADVVALQEVSPAYAAALAQLPDTRLVGNGQQRVIARDQLRIDAVRHHRLSTRGWPVRRTGDPAGPWHDAATATSVRVDGWLRLMSVHLPNYERSIWHRFAYRQAATRIVRYQARRRRRSTTH